MGFFPGIVFPHRGHASVDLAELDTSEQQSARDASECEANFESIKKKVILLQQKVSEAKSSKKIIPELKELKAKVHQIREFMRLLGEANSLMKKISLNNPSTKNYLEITSSFKKLNEKFIDLSGLDDVDDWEIVSDHELISISNDSISALIQYLSNSLKEMEKKLPEDPLASLKNFILAYPQGVSQIPEEFFKEGEVVALAQVLKDRAKETKFNDLIRDLKKLQNFHSGQEDKFVESLEGFVIKFYSVIYGDGYVDALRKEANFEKFRSDCLEDLRNHGFDAFTEKLTNEIISLFVRAAMFGTKYMSINPSQFLWIPGDQEEKVLAQLDKVLEGREFFTFL